MAKIANKYLTPASQLGAITPTPGSFPRPRVGINTIGGQTEAQFNELLANSLYGTEGEYGSRITAEGLGPYMAADPLYNAYDLTNNINLIKSFAEDPRVRGDVADKMDQLLNMQSSYGYTYPYGRNEDIYIRDLNKFVNKPDVLNPNTMGNIYETNKRMSDVISHELRHQLMQTPMATDIRKERKELLSQVPSKKREEIFNRFLDLKSNQFRGQLETTPGGKIDWRNLKGDYRDYDYLDYALQDTENIPMMGSAFAWQQKLDPLVKKFFSRFNMPSTTLTRFNLQKKLGLGDQRRWEPERDEIRTPPKKTVTPRHAPHPDRGGYEQSGGNAGGAQLSSGMTTGQHAAFRMARGGLMDIPLPGRNRDI